MSSAVVDAGGGGSVLGTYVLGVQLNGTNAGGRMCLRS